MIVGIQILLPELGEIVSMEGKHSTGHRDWPIGILRRNRNRMSRDQRLGDETSCLTGRGFDLIVLPIEN